MPNKVLFCATVDYHFSAFHLPILEWFKRQGWEVHVAAKGEMKLPFVDRKFNIPIERSPLSKSNRIAYRQLKAIMNEQQYKLVHCHTPMGGVLARLAAKGIRENGASVIYTAHGFHFCKGAPLLNWLIYYPIERYLSKATDCLITINEEDFARATSHKFKARRIEHIHGVGINTDRFCPLPQPELTQRRREYGYRRDDFLLFYAAEFNANKNHQLLIRAVAKAKQRVPNLKLLLAGKGAMLDGCRRMAERLGVASMIDFLGFRKDIDRLLPMCDAAVASSLREGLPVNIMEAMASGLPVIATRNRGHNELIADCNNGFLTGPDDADLFADKIALLAGSEVLKRQMGMEGVRRVRKYELKQVKQELAQIYAAYMTGEEHETESQYRSAYI